jgi:hypothetical protein
MCGGACFPPPPGYKGMVEPPNSFLKWLVVVLVVLACISPIICLGYLAYQMSKYEPSPAQPVPTCLRYETRTTMQYMPGVMGVGHPGVGSYRMVTRKHCVEYEQQ